jgi:acylphosphatase
LVFGPNAEKPLCRSVYVRIEGRVQGVGFRQFVLVEAQARGLDGFVRNRRDGGVEAVFVGAAAAVDTMLEVCQLGPRGSNVQMVKVIDETRVIGAGFKVEVTV